MKLDVLCSHKAESIIPNADIMRALAKFPEEVPAPSFILMGESYKPVIQLQVTVAFNVTITM